MAIEFTIGGHDYRAVRLDCFAQLHVTRKLAPVLPKLFPALALFQGQSAESVRALASDMSVIGQLVTPLAEALANMPKDDVDLVMTACVSVVSRRQDSTWSPIWRNGTFMFSDIELDTALPIVVHVLRDSLGNFIAGFLSKSAAPNPAVPG